jgi:biotin transport system substrate-specific component
MLDVRSPRTLLDVAWPDGAQARRLTTAAAVLFGVCLLTLSAKVQVPFWPVPMTMQSLVVIMLGMAYGSRLAVATVCAYLLAGAAGLPVFAGTPARGIGLAYMMGPTAGFLVGWDRTFLKCAAVMVLGHLAISLSGVVWLAILMGTTKAIDVGLTPFLASSALKTALGAACMPVIWRILARKSATQEWR